MNMTWIFHHYGDRIGSLRKQRFANVIIKDRLKIFPVCVCPNSNFTDQPRSFTVGRKLPNSQMEVFEA